MKKVICSFLMLLSISCFAAAQNYLFLQTSTNGELSKDNKGYTLEIKAPDKYITYFTDRPARSSGIIPLKKFLKLWQDPKISNNFKQSPPNVAITYKDSQGKHISFTAEVSKPIFQGNILKYHIKPLGANSGIAPINIEYIAIFFDDIHWNPGGF